MDLVFVDFYDSFSHNILAYLKTWDRVKIIAPHQANDELMRGTQRFVWGPGPGRVEDYDIDLELLRRSLENASHRHWGICLGHQLLGLALGGHYGREAFPRHGTTQTIDLPLWEDWGLTGQRVTVQSYNSLTVEIEPSERVRVWRHDGVVLMIATNNSFSCQFHPESVGTSCPELFFSGVQRNFL